MRQLQYSILCVHTLCGQSRFEFSRTSMSLFTRHHSIAEYSGLPKNKKQDIRAHQRTYDGAYMRSAVGLLSFSLLILKLFSREFLTIGALYTVYGTLVLAIGTYHKHRVRVYTHVAEEGETSYFTTGGNTVLLMAVISFLSEAVLLYLLLSL